MERMVTTESVIQARVRWVDHVTTHIQQMTDVGWTLEHVTEGTTAYRDEGTFTYYSFFWRRGS